jgi:excisionase family DNA binding protein
MEQQHLFNLSAQAPPIDGPIIEITPNLWLLSSEDMPPLLFTTKEAARFLRVGQNRIYDLIRQRELRSVKVGGSRRISARALSDYVTGLESEDSS